MILLSLVQTFVTNQALYMDSINYFNLIVYTGYFLLFINIIFYSKSYRNKSMAFRVIIGYLLYTFIIQMFADYMSEHKIHNLFLTHYYFIGQLILFSYFYYLLLNKPIFKKIIIVVLSIVTTIIGVQYFNTPELYYTFNLWEVVLSFTPIVIYSLFYFYESFGVENKKYLILSSGIFFYLLSATLIFSAGNLINSADKYLSIPTWTLNAFLYVVYQLFIFIEWYRNFRKPETTSINNEDEILL